MFGEFLVGKCNSNLLPSLEPVADVRLKPRHKSIQLVSDRTMIGGQKNIIISQLLLLRVIINSYNCMHIHVYPGPVDVCHP